MKGQMIFQFIVAAVIFFSIVFFIINYLNNTISTFGGNSFNDLLQAKTIEVSEILTRFEGRWVDGKPVVAGLAKEWPVLDTAKIKMFEEACKDDYDGLLDTLGLNEGFSDLVAERRFSAKITIEKEGEKIVDCGPQVPGIRTGSANRVAVSEDNKLLKITVNLW